MKQRLEGSGIAATPQRLAVADALLGRPQHLTAEQVHTTVNRAGRKVSVATVYNTLKLFCARGLAREVVVEPSRVFFDSTTEPHHHFFNPETGELADIPPEQIAFTRLPQAPAGTEAEDVQVIVRLRNKMSRKS